MITAVDVIMRELPLRQRQAMGRGSADGRQQSVFVRVADADGHFGVGEASAWPLFGGHSARGQLVALTELVGPSLVGVDERQFSVLDARISTRVPGLHVAKAAAQIAVLDLLARIRDEPMYAVFGGDPSVELGLSYSVALQDPAAERDRVVALYEQGYRTFKLKTGVLPPSRDVARLYALRQACPEARVRLDYNEAGTEEALRAIRGPAAEVGVEYCEQPFPARQDGRLERLRSWFDIPISLDESISTVADLLAAARLGLCEYVSLKCGKVGGPIQLIEMGRLAVHLGMTPYAGSLSETRLGVSAALAAFSAVPGLASGSDFYFPYLIVDDAPVTGGPEVRSGALRLRETRGHGCAVPDQWWRDPSAVHLTL